MLRTMWLHAHDSGWKHGEFWQELRTPCGISFTILAKFSWLWELCYICQNYTLQVYSFLLHVSYMLQSTLKRESICCQLKIDSMLIRNALFSKLFFRIWFPSSLCFTGSMCNSLEIKKCKFLCVCVYVVYIYVRVFTCVWGCKIDNGCLSQFCPTLFIKVRSCLNTRLTYFCKLMWPACSTDPQYWPPEC